MNNNRLFWSNWKKKLINNNLTLRQSYTCFTISECLQSYGENCQHPCSEHCINQTCDRFNGTCLLGRRGTEKGDTLVLLCFFKSKFNNSLNICLNKWKNKIITLITITLSLSVDVDEDSPKAEETTLWKIGFLILLAVLVFLTIGACTILRLR